MLTSFEGSILGQGVALVSLSATLPHLCVHFYCKTLMYQNLNQICNILYLEHLIHSLYACTHYSNITKSMRAKTLVDKG
jgi:hypothetical protein